jgi:hypothetical protein
MWFWRAAGKYLNPRTSINSDDSYEQKKVMGILGEALNAAFEFTRAGLEWPRFFMSLGGLLWVGTVVAAALTANHVSHNPDANLYWAVMGTTLATMVPLVFDYSKDAKQWTPLTVALGSFAYLTSVALWSHDISNEYRLSTFVVQTCAVSIQLAAIFNQRRQTSGNYHSPGTRSTFL